MDFEKLKNLMDHFVEENYAPGNTIKVYHKGEEAFSYSCGYSDLEKRAPMKGDEHFNLYSCSKITTVTAAMQLLEKGKFLLSDPIYEYIPEYKTMYIKSPDGQIKEAKNNITVKNLFNMTAGLTYNSETEAFQEAKRLTDGKMNTDVVTRCIAKDPLEFEPGERFRYSLCHDVLAGLVEIVSGKKFRDYVKENIFEPLEMKNSVYHLTEDIKKNMATQYRFVPKEEKAGFDMVSAQQSGNDKAGVYVEVGYENSHIHGEEYDSGGAGIISTASDYIKLAAALASYGKGTNGERILSRAAVELMRTNSLTPQQLETFNWPQLIGYGYGLGVRTMIDKAKGGSLGNIGEFGWGGAAGASVYIDPEAELAAVYLKHTLNPREGYYQPRIRNVLYACL